MKQTGEHGNTTAGWDEDDFIYGPSIQNHRPPDVSIEVNVEGVYGELEDREDGTATEKIDGIDQDAPSYDKQHQMIWSEDGTVLAEFDWINADVARIAWRFDKNADGTPITVYTYDDCINSHSTYDAIVILLGVVMLTIPVSAAVAYGVKKRKT